MSIHSLVGWLLCLTFACRFPGTTLAHRQNLKPQMETNEHSREAKNLVLIFEITTLRSVHALVWHQIGAIN